MQADETATFATLESRLRTILPEEYQDSYEEVQPVSMGSAGLRFDAAGKVAWNEIWGSFCDLAMAGGPPHKGTLLEPAPPDAIAADQDRYRLVVHEICRGITMVTGLVAHPAPLPGWVRVSCPSIGMADWLLRAIAMENVAVHRMGSAVDLPAGPHYRLEKEIKNVVTAIAKTSHYWTGHMPPSQRATVSQLLVTLGEESPLVTPARAHAGPAAAAVDALAARLAATVRVATGLSASTTGAYGWLGLECPDIRAAIWMMRMLVVSNVLARRERTVLFVPVNPATDPDGALVASAVARTHRLAASRGVS